MTIQSPNQNVLRMSDDEDSWSTLDRIRAKKQEVSPKNGYQLAEWDMMKPPEDQIMKRSQWWLTLSGVSIPETTEFTDWSVFDRHINDYVTTQFEELPEEPDPESVSEALETISDGDEADIRRGLVRLVRIAEHHPAACEPAVPALVELLPDSDLAVKAEITAMFDTLAEEDTELVSPALDVLGDFLTPATDDRVLKDVLKVIWSVADDDPSAVTDLVPRFEVLLKDEINEAVQVFLVLEQVADTHPETLLPIVPTIIEYTTDTSSENRVGALSVLGRVSKAYPNVSTDVIPVAEELLDVDNEKLRANAAGLLADQAEEYPEEVLPAVPDAIELLDDTDEHVRYNATSILSRVAEHDPDAVKPATELLIDALTEDNAATRENACWALGRINASVAKDSIHTHAQKDPNERVRNVASWALGEIDEM